MCTVSFVKKENGQVVLTSNRDEKTHRSTISPKEYNIEGNRIIFPKDELAGGTWIALGEQGTFCCLLNGAFTKHTAKGNYRRSRGQIVLDVFRSTSVDKFLEKIDLDNVEPFTLIIYQSTSQKLNLLVWDEKKKHISELDTNKPHFWGSATLYTKGFTDARRTQFFEHLKHDKGDESIFKKHSSSKDQGGFVLNNREGIETVSVTQIILSKLKGSMSYFVLNKNLTTKITKEWKKELQ